MKAGQNTTFLKPYFNDGISRNREPGGWKEIFKQSERTKKNRNVARSSKKKKK